jgi:hypothetical protein
MYHPLVTHDAGIEEEIPLSGGNVSGTVRVGDTVRRRAGPWTPAVHALLRHLEAAGFDGAPRVLGFDAKGRESLTYLPSEAGSMMPMPAYMWSDEALVAAAQLVRRYHDAVASFAAPEDARWRVEVGAPDAGEIICHNDLAPWNTVYRDGKPESLIDWDFAAPGSRLWDVADAVWRFVPYYEDWKCRIVGLDVPPDYARRTRLLCDAYGLDDRSALLDTVRRRQQVLSDTIRAWGGANEPGFLELLRTGYDRLPLQDILLLESRWEEIAAAL